MCSLFLRYVPQKFGQMLTFAGKCSGSLCLIISVQDWDDQTKVSIAFASDRQHWLELLGHNSNDPSGVRQILILLTLCRSIILWRHLVINGLRKFIWSCWGFGCGHGQKWPREFHLKTLPWMLIFAKDVSEAQVNVYVTTCFDALEKLMSIVRRVLTYLRIEYKLNNVFWHIGKHRVNCTACFDIFAKQK